MFLIINLFLISQSNLTPTELYNQGNEYYTAGNYGEAIKAYEQAGVCVTNANLFLNLGNSYFKTARIGKAILNYRRAQFLTPRDADVIHNIAFARSYRVDKVNPSSSPITVLLSNIFHYFSMFEAQIIATISFIIAVIFISIYIVYRRNACAYTAGVFVVLFVFFFINWQVWAGEMASHHAIVVIPEVDALSGPGEDYKKILVIHDGSEVSIRETRGDYVLIQLPGGMGGWVQQNALEKIN